MKIRNRIVAAMMTTVLTASSVLAAAPQVTLAKGSTDIGNLTVNYQEDALGVETDQLLRFSWNMNSDLQGQSQKAYEIQLYKAGKMDTPVWASGKVESSQSTGIAYNIDSLEKETKYVWTVTVETGDGSSIVSDPASFITDTSMDDTSWIIPKQDDPGMPLLRTEQKLKDQKVESAYLYISSLGTYTAFIDGKEVKIGDDFDDIFNPGWTDYKYYTNYQTYEVTDYIQDATLTMGIELGNGWYAGKIGASGNYGAVFGVDDKACELGVIAKLVIHYEDGSTQYIKTDTDNWKSSTYSPVTANDFFDGENYDANIAKEIAGWNDDGYLDAKSADVKAAEGREIAEEVTESQELGIESEDTSEVSTDENSAAEAVAENLETSLEGNAKNTSAQTTKASQWNGVTEGTYTGELRSGTKSTARIADEYDREAVSAYTYKESENLTAEQAGNDYGAVVEQAVDVKGDISLKAGEKLIVDFGQNGAGAVELTVDGKKDTVITMDHAEMLNDGCKNPTLESGGSDGAKGSLYKKAITNAEVTDTYILSDEGTQTFLPVYTFHGFRYAEISADQDVVIHKAVAKVYTSVGDQTGTIETNNSDVNKLFSNTLWSQKSNYLSIPTDCPQRGERAGWTGDAQLFAATGVYTYDVFSFLENYNDMMQEHAKQNNDSYGAIMPTGFVGFFASMVASGWSDAGVIIPWVLYQQTGDETLITQYYDQMDAYMDVVNTKGYNPAMFGDWLAFSGASTPYLNAVYQIYCTSLMEKMAKVLGDDLKAKKYVKRYEELKAAFMEKYVDDQANILSSSADQVTVSNHGYEVVDNAQTAILWALKCGLYESDSQRDIMIKNLLRNIKNENSSVRADYDENTLSVGFLGINVILPVLTDIGAADTAYDLLLQDTLPSWLYSVKNGATTIWERWNSYSTENSFGDSGMNSFNHYSYGACVEWMFKYMGGISMDEENPGFQKIILQPTIDESGRITYVNSSYDSLYGTIVSNWKAKDGKLSEYSITIPANTTAKMYLEVSEYVARQIAKTEGVNFVQMTTHNSKQMAEFSVTSGSYDFSDFTDEQQILDDAKKAQEEADKAKEEAKAAEAAAKKAEAAAVEAQKKSEAERIAAEKAAEEARAAAAQAKEFLAQAQKAAAEAKAAADKLSSTTVKRTAVKKVSSTKKNQAKVVWKKLSGVGGYQVQYATNKSFKKAKTKTISKSSTTSITLKKLKAGKKYYVRVRAYKKADGKKVYGKYSSAKRVIVKKA